MYKLKDLQGGGLGLKEDYVFESLQEIKENLVDYHSIDNNDTDKWSLIDCLEIGSWGITDLNGAEIDYNKINI